MAWSPCIVKSTSDGIKAALSRIGIILQACAKSITSTHDIRQWQCPHEETGTIYELMLL